MYVFDSFRNQGIARKIVEFLLKSSPSCQNIYCIPFEHLVPFYGEFGFAKCSNLKQVPEEIAKKYSWCQGKYSNPTSLLVLKKETSIHETDPIRLVKCAKNTEWDFAKKLRNKYFFDPLAIKDPYTWTFDHEEHVHFILYQGDTMTGYAHIQLWPEHRAALRIIVMDEPYRNHGLGSHFLQHCERWLKTQGIKSLHEEARPDAIKFYRKNGFVGMPLILVANSQVFTT